MIDTSQTFKDLMQSNIRPKCEPVIRVSGTDNTGKEITLEWTASNIKDMTYRRGIDPAGRSSSYMELTWTEIYTGKLNAQNYPEKYNNVIKNMAVELSFVQDLGRYGTWDWIAENTTWDTLYNKGMTWDDLYRGNAEKLGLGIFAENITETVTMPIMYLDARPTIEGNVITWTAKDILQFLPFEETKAFRLLLEDEYITDVNAINYFVLNGRSAYLDSPKIFNALTKTADSLLKGTTNKIVSDFLCTGKTNDSIRNIASIFSRHFDFADDVLTLKYFNPLLPVYHYSSNVIYQYPKITQSGTVSTYSITMHIFQKEENRVYEKEPSTSVQILGENFYLFDYDQYGTSGKAETITRGYDWNDDVANVTPLNYVSVENTGRISDVGEAYIENNPVMPFSGAGALRRVHFIRDYFNNKASFEFSSLPNVSIETGDTIAIDTNLFDGENRITKNAMVVSIELSYNGAMKQNIIAHEVSL
jgi:hypothetical protein